MNWPPLMPPEPKRTEPGWIEFDGDQVTIHPALMGAGQHYFRYEDREYAVLQIHGEIRVVRAGDLSPQIIPTVWHEKWRLAQ